MDNGTIGEIKLFAGTYQPKNWFYCDGRRLEIRKHMALYSILGSLYGGDDLEYFNLPNMNKDLTDDQPKYIICIIGEYPQRDM